MIKSIVSFCIGVGYAAGDVVLWNYVGGNAVNYSDPSGLVKWKDAGMAGLGLASNSFGLVLGVGFAFLPEPTLATKIAAGAVLTKSGYGFMANAANMVAAIRDKKPVSTGGLFADVACKASGGNKTAKGLASAGDLAFDLLMGQVAGQAAKQSYGILGRYGVERAFVRDPARLGNTATTIQVIDAGKTTYEVLNEK
ncbi:hypothetical protein FY034_17540 (plasmid) [Trichlorobacter lovleyi]|uniref:hypothetical protein n=1 Tax=Trichlorobacter lovleyi TaxID=313985 RepID=UPI00224054E3|nr:hypothetical protein [Trichlorobacter lovleyi]QOX80827.1 hypothetical protein FY034_17540 [Trichlorobacter lovleyi]